MTWQAARLGEGPLAARRGKPFALDEDDTLALTRDTSQCFDALSQVALLKRIAWTPMTGPVRSSACVTTRHCRDGSCRT